MMWMWANKLLVGWWFIFPMFGSAMILVVIQRLITGSKTWLQVIMHEYALLNGMLFLTWLTFGQVLMIICICNQLVLLLNRI